MRNSMNHFARTSALLLISATLPACAIKRQDVLECGLPDKSKFILRAKYDWHPISRLIPEAAERTNHSGFIVYYKAAENIEEIGPIADTQYSYNYKDLSIAKRQCSVYGLINKVPYTATSNYKTPISNKFTSINIDRDLFFSPDQGGNPPIQVREALDKLDATFSAAAIIWRPDRLIVERRVIKNKPPFSNLAVYRIESRDGGQIWTNPHITIDAEAFDLGKTYDEQCFIARPIRIDDQKIEAPFPPCPISERLPD